MNPHSALHGLVATAALAAGLAHGPLAHAQAPGEDPVVLTKKLTVNMQPTGGVAAPGQLDNNGAMPSWLRARIARYEAKAFAGDSSGIISDSDVVTTASAQGMQKTCVQEVGSNTVSATSSSGSKYGPSQTARWWCCAATWSTSADKPPPAALPSSSRSLSFFSICPAPAAQLHSAAVWHGRWQGRPGPHIAPKASSWQPWHSLHPTPQFAHGWLRWPSGHAPPMASRATTCPGPACTSPHGCWPWAHC